MLTGAQRPHGVARDAVCGLPELAASPGTASPFEEKELMLVNWEAVQVDFVFAFLLNSGTVIVL